MCVICLLLAVSRCSFATDRAHTLAQKAASQHPVHCSGHLTLKTCHVRFADGCSTARHPNYDAYLDFLKNQNPGASVASTTSLTKADLVKLEGQLTQLPSALNDKNHARLATALADQNEGNIVTVIGYLYFAEDTGSGAGAIAETSNCRVPAANSFDYHLGIGFDPAVATNAQNSHFKSTASSPTEKEKTSVVAEMTPHTRHPQWTIARVSAQQGKQVKVVGQLMADNVHFNARDDCGFSSAEATCWRSTIWEIHPITQFFVCNLSTPCDQNSPDSAWTSLDALP
jgi:hypothetical protein